MIIIPSRETKQLTNTSKSKILGNLWSTLGLDLQSNLGVTKLSPRLLINTAGVTNQGLSVGFKTFNNKVYTVADTRVFGSSALNLVSSFTEDASTGAITSYSADYSDIETFNNVLCTSATDKLMSFSGSTWTQRATFSASDSLHKLCYHPRNNRLYYIDTYKEIKSIDVSWSEATSNPYFLSLDYRFGLPYTMLSDGQDIWIGTVKTIPNSVMDMTSGSSIIRWDGTASTFTSVYPIRANGILAMCRDKEGAIYAIDSNGALLAFSGGGFQEVDRLPLNRELLINATPASKYNAFIHPNGFTLSRKGTLMILINNLVGDNAGSINENMPSGVWEWTKETGFIHRQSPTYTTVGSSTVTDYGQNRVSQVGALAEPNIYSTSSSGKPTLICGMTYYTNASSTSTGIFVDDPLDTIQKYGYFVSTWILATGLKDTWKKLGARYRQFLNSDDKIIFKYRTRESASQEISGTWLNTTNFSTATNVSALVGYEVEVLQGTGSGKCSHITTVTGSGPYTVTVDETYTGVTSGTFKARIQNWTKHTSVANQTTESNLTAIMKVNDTERIQIKVCMQFTGEDELYETILINSTKEPLEEPTQQP